MSQTPAPPRPAATVVLARALSGDLPLEQSAFEVLLVKRSGKSGFMAGAHVFPGGRVEESDAEPASLVGEACSALLDGMEPRAATALCMAAIRETAEEAGIHLMTAGVVDVGRLHAWSWWITPEAEPKRFDTRFFLAAVSAGTEARIDEHEAVAHAWWTPRGALDAYARGEIVLAPPTLCTLEDLAPFATLGAAIASVARPVRPVCPRLVTGDSALAAAGAHAAGAHVASLVLALPGDALHDEPEPVFAGRTRVVMTANGRFASASMPARRGS